MVAAMTFIRPCSSVRCPASQVRKLPGRLRFWDRQTLASSCERLVLHEWISQWY